MGLGGQWDQSGVEAQVRTGVLGVGVSGWFEPLQLFGVVLALSKRVLLQMSEWVGMSAMSQTGRRTSRSPRAAAPPLAKSSTLQGGWGGALGWRPPLAPGGKGLIALRRNRGSSAGIITAASGTCYQILTSFWGHDGGRDPDSTRGPYT